MHLVRLAVLANRKRYFREEMEYLDMLDLDAPAHVEQDIFPSTLQRVIESAEASR